MTREFLNGMSTNHALVSIIPGMPRVAFQPETGSGQGGDADAERAAADAAAAQAAAAKELEDAEAAAAAAEDDSKDAAALKAEKVKLLREVMEKKNKLREAEGRAADAAAALAAYEGVDPAKVRELLKREADAEKSAAEAKGDFDRVKAMMAEEHAKETGALKAQIDALNGQLGDSLRTIDTLTVGNDFSGSAFIQKSLTLTPTKARALYGAHFEVKDGRTVAYDKPAGAAGRTMMVDARGEPLAFDDAFKRIIEADPDKEMLLKAKVAPGSGSSSTQTKSQEQPKNDGLFGKSRIAAGLANFD